MDKIIFFFPTDETQQFVLHQQPTTLRDPTEVTPKPEMASYGVVDNDDDAEGVAGYYLEQAANSDSDSSENDDKNKFTDAIGAVDPYAYIVDDGSSDSESADGYVLNSASEGEGTEDSKYLEGDYQDSNYVQGNYQDSNYADGNYQVASDRTSSEGSTGGDGGDGYFEPKNSVSVVDGGPNKGSASYFDVDGGDEASSDATSYFEADPYSVPTLNYDGAASYLAGGGQSYFTEDAYSVPQSYFVESGYSEGPQSGAGDSYLTSDNPYSDAGVGDGGDAYFTPSYSPYGADSPYHPDRAHEYIRAGDEFSSDSDSTDSADAEVPFPQRVPIELLPVSDALNELAGTTLDNIYDDRGHRDWCTEFNRLLSLKVHDMKSRIHRLLLMQRLSHEFKTAATAIAQTIIREIHLPLEKKTIKPVDAGGVAGGEKFIHQNVFCKFAFDTEGLYSGDSYAAKAAGRELLGLQSYFDWIISEQRDLKVALTVMVDYLGYRINCASCLPLGKYSLRYGSDDGGRSVHADSLPLNALMRDAGIYWNLKKHSVAGTDIYGPGDIEAHVGSDGNFYVLDTARVFPCEVPPKFFQGLFVPCDGPIEDVDLASRDFLPQVNSMLGGEGTKHQFLLGTAYVVANSTVVNVRVSGLVGFLVHGKAVLVPNGHKGKFLYNLMRPEFVRNYKTPLSSDAYSGFGRHNYKEHNEELRSANLYLRSTVVPKLADDLMDGTVSARDGQELTRLVHSRGIPIRMLGLLWSSIPQAKVSYATATEEKQTRIRLLCFSEMYSRCLKVAARSVMRIPSTSGPRLALLMMLNLVFGSGKKTRDYQDTVMNLLLRSKFGAYVKLSSTEFVLPANPGALYLRLSQIAGFVIPQFNPFQDGAFAKENPFDLSSKVVFSSKIKSLVRQSAIDSDIKKIMRAPKGEGYLRVFRNALYDMDPKAFAPKIMAIDIFVAKCALSSGQVDEALNIVQSVLSQKAPFLIPAAALFLLGETLVARKAPFNDQYRAYASALALLERHQSDPFTGELNHPFGLQILDRLAALSIAVDSVQLFLQCRKKFDALFSQVGSPSNFLSRFLLWGRPASLCSSRKFAEWMPNRSSRIDEDEENWMALGDLTTGIVSCTLPSDNFIFGLDLYSKTKTLTIEPLIFGVPRAVVRGTTLTIWAKSPHQRDIDPQYRLKLTPMASPMQAIETMLTFNGITRYDAAMLEMQPSNGAWYGALETQNFQSGVYQLVIGTQDDVVGQAFFKIGNKDSAEDEPKLWSWRLPLPIPRSREKGRFWVTATPLSFNGDFLQVTHFEEQLLVIQSNSHEVFCYSKGERDQFISLAGVSVQRIIASPTAAFFLTEKGDVYSMGKGSSFVLGHGNTQDVKIPKFIQALQGRRIIDLDMCASDRYGMKVAVVTSRHEILMWGKMSTFGDSYHVEQDENWADAGIKATRVALTSAAVYVLDNLGLMFYMDSTKRLDHTVEFITALKNVYITEITSGESHCLALSNEGYVYSFGIGEKGQLGSGITRHLLHSSGKKGRSSSDLFKPNAIHFRVPHISDIVQIDATGDTSVALNANGEAFVWGGGCFIIRRVPIPSCWRVNAITHGGVVAHAASTEKRPPAAFVIDEDTRDRRRLLLSELEYSVECLNPKSCPGVPLIVDYTVGRCSPQSLLFDVRHKKLGLSLLAHRVDPKISSDEAHNVYSGRISLPLMYPLPSNLLGEVEIVMISPDPNGGREIALATAVIVSISSYGFKVALTTTRVKRYQESKDYSQEFVRCLIHHKMVDFTHQDFFIHWKVKLDDGNSDWPKHFRHMKTHTAISDRMTPVGSHVGQLGVQVFIGETEVPELSRVLEVVDIDQSGWDYHTWDPLYLEIVGNTLPSQNIFHPLSQHYYTLNEEMNIICKDPEKWPEMSLDTDDLMEVVFFSKKNYPTQEEVAAIALGRAMERSHDRGIHQVAGRMYKDEVMSFHPWNTILTRESGEYWLALFGSQRLCHWIFSVHIVPQNEWLEKETAYCLAHGLSPPPEKQSSEEFRLWLDTDQRYFVKATFLEVHWKLADNYEVSSTDMIYMTHHMDGFDVSSVKGAGQLNSQPAKVYLVETGEFDLHIACWSTASMSFTTPADKVTIHVVDSADEARKGNAALAGDAGITLTLPGGTVYSQGANVLTVAHTGTVGVADLLGVIPAGKPAEAGHLVRVAKPQTSPTDIHIEGLADGQYQVCYWAFKKVRECAATAEFRIVGDPDKVMTNVRPHYPQGVEKIRISIAERELGPCDMVAVLPGGARQQSDKLIRAAVVSSHTVSVTTEGLSTGSYQMCYFSLQNDEMAPVESVPFQIE